MKKHIFIIPLGMSLLVTIVCIASGNLAFPTLTATPIDMRKFSASIAFTTLIGYLSFLSLNIVENYKATILSLCSETEQRTIPLFLQEIIKRSLAIGTVVGSIIGFSYMYFEGVLLSSQNFGGWALNSVALLFWILCITTISLTILITNSVVSRYLNNFSLDLFGLQKVDPFSRLVVSNAVMVAVFYILIPLFWIGIPIPILDIPIIFATLLLFILFLFRPVFKLQSIITETKTLALKRINKKLEEALEENICGGRRITDDPKTLRKVASLVAAKSEISKVREWPIDVPQSLKVVAITIAAPMSMVAGSLVDYAIHEFNLFGF